jgi:hypothetical protein
MIPNSLTWQMEIHLRFIRSKLAAQTDRKALRWDVNTC